MRSALFISAFLLISGLVSGQKNNTGEVVLAYYNADRLYDLTDDAGKYDDEFTASGKMFWGEERYKDKIESVSKILSNINNKNNPEIIILSGIENRAVVDDLLNSKSLKKSKYIAYIAGNGKGATVALLASSDHIRSVEIKQIEATGLDNYEDILIAYATVEMDDGNGYHLFLNSWPERSGESGGSEQLRLKCAVEVRKKIDNILNFEQDARILVLGTFNDEPTNRSIISMLNATNKRKNLNYRDLYNPFYDIHNNNGDGTVIINGKKQLYDYIIVSPALLNSSSGYSIEYNSGVIEKGELTNPIPTFKGDEYIGGAGGHFPVYIKLKREVNQ